MRRFAFAAAVVLCVLALFELGLRSAGFEAPAKVLDYRLRVAGELYGEPDQFRFWRLLGPGPRFSADAYKIVCLADSVTVMDQGKGYPDDLSAALARAGYSGKVQAFNAGVPEYTSFQGLVYFERELAGTQPDLVTVQFGINDHFNAEISVPDALVRMPDPLTLRAHRFFLSSRLYQAIRAVVLRLGKDGQEKPLRVPPEAYAENLERITADARAAGALVVFVAAPYLDLGQEWTPLHRRYIQLTQTTGERLGVTVIDLTDRFRFSPELFIDPAGDHFHFTREGGRLIADAVAQAIVPQLKPVSTGR